MPPTPRVARTPNLPSFLKTKLYKTGQTRGADDDEIFQNRVGRNSTVLIDYAQWTACAKPDDGSPEYAKGYIVLVDPDWYFAATKAPAELAKAGLVLGENALLFYQTRKQWDGHNPEKLGWQEATSRSDPLGGNYVARISATTAESGTKITRGFTSRLSKGAGIRVYEYASAETIRLCRLQLETLLWSCRGAADAMASAGMTRADALKREQSIRAEAKTAKMLDLERLRSLRIVNQNNVTVCPLCLDEIPASLFFNRIAQAEGRKTLDQTVTEVSLFHIQELRVGRSQHKPYNLGWGHHHCNVVTKDSGILETLAWMRGVLDRNTAHGG